LDRTKWVMIFHVLMTVIVGCSSTPDYSSVDIQGEIIEVDEEQARILVDDKRNGQTWVKIFNLDNMNELHKPLEVVVWLDGNVSDGNPPVGTANRVEVVK